MARRGYSNVATPLVVSGTLNNSDTSSTFTTTTTPSGWPTAPFFACLDAGTSSEELVLVTTQAGSSFTVTRGGSLGTTYGSTTKAHSASAALTHVAAAPDFDEANSHVNASSGVHGRTGAVVGTTDAQTLSNKTLTQPVIGDFTNATHTHLAAASGGAINVPADPRTKWACLLTPPTSSNTTVTLATATNASQFQCMALQCSNVVNANATATRNFTDAYSSDTYLKSGIVDITARMRLSQAVNVLNDMFVGVGDGPASPLNTSNGAFLVIDGGGTVKTAKRVASALTSGTTTSTVTPNAYHDYRITYPAAGGTATVYVDGVQVGTIATVPALTLTSAGVCFIVGAECGTTAQGINVAIAQVYCTEG